MKIEIPVDALINWYCKYKRDVPWRRNSHIYPVWVSEVMLQQTQVATVVPYFKTFMKKFPTIIALAKSSEQEVLKQWEGLGYYSRARNLHRAAQLVLSDYQGHIPRDLKSFVKLPGVGPYISAAVLSISQGIPIPVVDGNVLRVASRFFYITSDISKTGTKTDVAKILEEMIPEDSPGEFNQALMELGALVCKAKVANCHICPLNERCQAKKMKNVYGLPNKFPRKKVPKYRVSIGVIVKDDGRFFIQRRPSQGHLGGLWEFPGGKSLKGEEAEATILRECREELNCRVEITKKLKILNHAYTHFKILMTVFICKLVEENPRPSEPVPWRWITVEQVRDYPFPVANHKFFPQLKDYLRRSAQDPRQ